MDSRLIFRPFSVFSKKGRDSMVLGDNWISSGDFSPSKMSGSPRKVFLSQEHWNRTENRHRWAGARMHQGEQAKPR